jgi:transposase
MVRHPIELKKNVAVFGHDQSKSELSLWYYSRVGDLKGRVRRIMIIALARKLVIALWRYVETGKVPTGAIGTA